MATAKTAEKNSKEPEAPLTQEEWQEQDKEQEERVQSLIDQVKEAFTSNQFAIPAGLDLQIRSMANLSPHHAPHPETQVGPGVAAEQALETPEERAARQKAAEKAEKAAEKAEHSHKK
jgi:hypothetical protein